MAQRTYRCGSSGSSYTLSADDRRIPDDREAVRLRTSLHLPAAASVGRAFRVLAQLADGGCALICLAATRAEALLRARAAGAVPAGAVRLRLQQWTGGVCAGAWQDLPCRGGELPSAGPVARRRLRGRGVRREG